MKLMRFVWNNILLLGFAWVIHPYSASAIINGQVVEQDHFLARSTVIVALKSYFIDGQGQCTGSLITDRLILTAAHCVVDSKTRKPESVKNLRVYFGNYERGITDSGLTYKVESLRYHQGYNSDSESFVHDIAILKLEKPAPLPFSPIQYLSTSVPLTRGADILIAGYGNMLFMEDTPRFDPRILRAFPTKILNGYSPKNGMIELYDAIELVETFGLVVPQTAGHPELELFGGMAAGDSGGPAVVVVEGIPYLAGVASGYRAGTISSRAPHYESVPAHANWIQKAIRFLSGTAASSRSTLQ